MILTLNGRALLDDELDEWQQKPPEAMLEYLKPGPQAQPWVKPAMITLADAALASRPVEIHVTTGEGGMFAMKVLLPTSAPDFSMGVQKMNMS